MIPQYQEYCTKTITKLLLPTLAFVGGWLNTDRVKYLARARIQTPGHPACKLGAAPTTLF